jgi:Fic family protein
LRHVTERADWEGWVQYFLNGVARQSEDALSRAERLNRLIENWRSTLAGRPNTRVALQMIDLLGANPFLTPRGAEQKLKLAYNTVMRAIGQLQDQGIVIATTEAKRDRLFCAKLLLDILEEPARLTPAEP